MLISPAYAEGALTSPEGGLLQLLPIVLMFVLLYFLMIRPQMKRAKEQKQMIDGLVKGDEVITAGGIVGKITKVGDSYVTIEVARRGEEGIEMNLQKAAIQTLLPKGSIKAM